jgi:hypothetical protein
MRHLLPAAGENHKITIGCRRQVVQCHHNLSRGHPAWNNRNDLRITYRKRFCLSCMIEYATIPTCWSAFLLILDEITIAIILPFVFIMGEPG